jgi:hypothetical protein
VDYFKTSAQHIEDIRARIKHSDPGTVDLNDIRDSLGPVISDLEILAALRHPESFQVERTEDGLEKITIVMVLDPGSSADMLRKLWIGTD